MFINYWQGGDKENKTMRDKKYAGRFMVIQLILPVFVAVNSAYIINYKPKIGVRHVWICSAIEAAAVIFSVWAVMVCVGALRRKTVRKRISVCWLIATISMMTLVTISALPYFKDLWCGTRTVTTDSYLAVRDNLYFRDNDGKEVVLKIPEGTAEEYRSRENSGFDPENGLLKHDDTVTVTYFPNSGVIVFDS